MTEINVLGTRYTIEIVAPADDSFLRNGDCDGYTDKSSKRIVVSDMSDTDLDDKEIYKKAVLRHELIHAFLNESGLQESWEHKKFGHEETTVDWFAKQFPKLVKAFAEVGCM